METTETAGLVARFVARLLDTIALVWLVALAGRFFVTEPGDQGNEVFDALFLASVICLYETVGVAGWGATPGKAITGLSVSSRDGGPAGFVKALSRVAPRTIGYLVLLQLVNVVFSVSAWPLVAILLAELAAFVALAVDDDRRAWWDYVAGTSVHRRN